MDIFQVNVITFFVSLVWTVPFFLGIEYGYHQNSVATQFFSIFLPTFMLAIQGKVNLEPMLMYLYLSLNYTMLNFHLLLQLA